MKLEQKIAVWLLEYDAVASVPALAGLDASAIGDVLRVVSLPGAAHVVVALGPTLAAQVLAQAETGWAARVLEQLPAAVAAPLVARIALPLRDEILDALPTRLASALRQRLAFERNSAAALMDEDAIALPGTTTVREAVQKLRDDGTQVPTVFVVDDRLRLIGFIEAGQLLVAKPQRTLAEIMARSISPIPSATPHSRLLEHPAWKGSATAAVVDGEGQFLGSLSLRAVVRAAEAATRGGHSDPAATSAALGDLFWLGIAGVLGAAAGGEPQPGGR